MSVIDIGTGANEMTKDMLMSAIKDAVKPGALILFYSDSCGHCNNMKPEWESLKKFAKQQKKKCNIVSVNADRRDKLDDSWRKLVTGVPTIVGINEGQDATHAIPFSDERTLDNFKKFIVSNIDPSYLSQGGGGSRKKKSPTRSKTRSKSKKTLRTRKKKHLGRKRCGCRKSCTCKCVSRKKIKGSCKCCKNKYGCRTRKR